MFFVLLIFLFFFFLCSFRPGLQIEKTSLNQAENEAFVTFTSPNDIESALNVTGKKLVDRFIKVYRSSMAQIERCRKQDAAKQSSFLSQAIPSARTKCEAYLKQLSSEPPRYEEIDFDCNESISEQSQISLGQLSIANLNRLIELRTEGSTKGQVKCDGSTGGMVQTERSSNEKSNEQKKNRVVARGFPCSARKLDVFKFFNTRGIRILGGIGGLNLINDAKKDVMEAYVDVASATDHDKALTLSGQLLESRIVTGRCQ